jgi:hypothetical protein
MRPTYKYSTVTRDEDNPACRRTDGRYQTASVKVFSFKPGPANSREANKASAEKNDREGFSIRCGTHNDGKTKK